MGLATQTKLYRPVFKTSYCKAFPFGHRDISAAMNRYAYAAREADFRGTVG